MRDILSVLIPALTGGGLWALFSQGIKARNSLRAGARASKRAVVRDMAEARQEAEARAEHHTRLAEFWRATAANYSYQLRSNGITPDPEHPVPPQVAVAADAAARATVREVEKAEHDRDDSGA